MSITVVDNTEAHYVDNLEKKNVDTDYTGFTVKKKPKARIPLKKNINGSARRIKQNNRKRTPAIIIADVGRVTRNELYCCSTILLL